MNFYLVSLMLIVEFRLWLKSQAELPCSITVSSSTIPCLFYFYFLLKTLHTIETVASFTFLNITQPNLGRRIYFTNTKFCTTVSWFMYQMTFPMYVNQNFSNQFAKFYLNMSCHWFNVCAEYSDVFSLATSNY